MTSSHQQKTKKETLKVEPEDSSNKKSETVEAQQEKFINEMAFALSLIARNLIEYE